MTLAVVFDCNVFLQAAANPTGPAGACWQAVQDDRVRLYASPEILAEVADVLSRPQLRTKFPALTDSAVVLFVRMIASIANIMHDPPRAHSIEADPKDDKYVNLAIAVNASIIVSRDQHLLRLTDGVAGEHRQFQLKHPEIRVMTPPAFLAVLAGTA